MPQKAPGIALFVVVGVVALARRRQAAGDPP
jgi:hypothetical protein